MTEPGLHSICAQVEVELRQQSASGHYRLELVEARCRTITQPEPDKCAQGLSSTQEEVIHGGVAQSMPCIIAWLALPRGALPIS